MSNALKYLTRCCLVLFFSHTSVAQDDPLDKFQGQWTGPLLISNNGSVVDSVDIRLTIRPLQGQPGLTWNTEYLSEKNPMVKDYKLIPSDSLENVYVLDEQNNIYLYQYLHGNKLYSQFEVQGTQLSSSYELKDDSLVFEVVSGKKLNITGGVTNFAVSNVQRAVLRRNNDNFKD